MSWDCDEKNQKLEIHFYESVWRFETLWRAVNFEELLKNSKIDVW